MKTFIALLLMTTTCAAEYVGDGRDSQGNLIARRWVAFKSDSGLISQIDVGGAQRAHIDRELADGRTIRLHFIQAMIKGPDGHMFLMSFNCQGMAQNLWGGSYGGSDGFSIGPNSVLGAMERELCVSPFDRNVSER